MPRSKATKPDSLGITIAPTQRYPVTPDGHYFVVRRRLWRCTDPTLSDARRTELTRQLMDARRALRGRGRSGGSKQDIEQREEAHQRVQAAKEGLGERGPVWWSADRSTAPVCDRKMVHNTPYAEWFAGLNSADSKTQRAAGSATESAVESVPSQTSPPTGRLRRSRRIAAGS